jgi:methyltransferase family protein
VTRALERQFSWLVRRFTPHTVFMHVGAGDCALALLAAGYVERVYAVDPFGHRLLRRLPVNLRLVLSDARGIPVPEGTVDVAFASEPLAHPLDAIRGLLAPGGVFLATDRALRPRLIAAGFSRARLPWFQPLVEAVK